MSPRRSREITNVCDWRVSRRRVNVSQCLTSSNPEICIDHILYTSTIQAPNTVNHRRFTRARHLFALCASNTNVKCASSARTHNTIPTCDIFSSNSSSSYFVNSSCTCVRLLLFAYSHSVRSHFVVTHLCNTARLFATTNRHTCLFLLMNALLQLC